jgi:peptidoglycan/xylan/chitin deacetylase (PgdA/CDA1 family)
VKVFETSAYDRVQQAAVHLAARALPYMPGRFSLARMLGPSYSLRCVLFHDISETESPFTKGLGVTIRPDDFEAALIFLTKRYTPVSLEDVLKESGGHPLPPRPVLVTFDDAYASVFEIALPLCTKLGIPSVLFVNALTVDNRCFALDNLVGYAANTSGMDAINNAIRSVGKASNAKANSLVLNSVREVFTRYLPAISLPTRQAFRETLLKVTGITEIDAAPEARLYLTSEQLRHLASRGFEIGNHTYTHVNCRWLRPEDLDAEIDRNKSVLEQILGTPVRSFSVPYGSSTDLTRGLVDHLRNSGHQAAFLVEGLANRPQADKFHLYRVEIRARADAALFSEIEVLPRLRR